MWVFQPKKSLLTSQELISHLHEIIVFHPFLQEILFFHPLMWGFLIFHHAPF